MLQQSVTLVVTINTINGGPWQHVYVLPQDHQQRHEVLNEISSKIQVLDQSRGIIFLRNPPAAYSVRNIVRFGWTLSDSSLQVAEEVDRQLGLNISR